MAEISDNYKPIVYQLVVDDKKTFDASPEFSEGLCYPLPSLGFQQFLHANVQKMELTKEFQGKRKVYSVMNRFEPTIYDYETGIEFVASEYFKFNDKQKILGNNFYHLWELANTFDIIPTGTEKFTSIHLNEETFASTQATMMFRKTFSKNSSKDLHYSIVIKQKRPEENASFLKSHSDQIKSETFGNLAEMKNIRFVQKFIKGKTDLITVNPSTEKKNLVTIEQDTTKLLIAEIYLALSLLEQNGSFICRIFETFTQPLNKIIYMIASMFSEVYLIKPLTSHASNAEKYLVCRKYKQKQKVMEQFEKLVEEMQGQKNLINVFPDLTLPTDFLESMTIANVEIANKQIIGINKISSFIKSQNYFGDAYVDGRDAQINASKFWIDSYLPNKQEFVKNTNALKKNIMKILEENEKRIKSMK